VNYRTYNAELQTINLYIDNESTIMYKSNSGSGVYSNLFLFSFKYIVS